MAKPSRSKEIRDATWAGEYGGTRGAVRLALQDFTLPRSCLSALSSTFYSAAGASVGIKRYVYGALALLLSELFALSRFGLLSFMTPNERDIRGSILARTGRSCRTESLRYFFLLRAEQYAESVAYAHADEPGMTESARRLALATLIRIHIDLKNRLWVLSVCEELDSFEREDPSPPKVATRVYRALGEGYLHSDTEDSSDRGVECLRTSQVIARDASITDAVNKTEAVARSLGVSL